LLGDLALLKVGPDLGIDLAVDIRVVNIKRDARGFKGGSERFGFGQIVVPEGAV
jgi:hypothetical protein